MFGVAGLPGGACFTIGCAASAAAGRKLRTSLLANGWPGCSARACCCFANGTGGGGGAVFAITCRLHTAGGARVTLFVVAVFPPRALSCVVGLTPVPATYDSAIWC